MDVKSDAARFKAVALLRYNEGWDTFIECYTDAEMEAFIKEAGGFDKAVKQAKRLASVWMYRRADARAEGSWL